MNGRHPLPASAQLHVDGLGLNDRITITADPRDPEGGNASHTYVAEMDVHNNGHAHPVAYVQFQHGPRDEPGSQSGCTDQVLVAILLDRYRGFQSGPFACRENALVVTKLEEALHWMQARARARHREGVLGKLQSHQGPR